MILLYGAGGEPGRGEIPMDPIRYRASDAFLSCTWGFEEKLSAATRAQRQTDIGRACMPSLGMMTVNALAAADSVIIPSQPSFLSAKGLDLFLRSISKVKRSINPYAPVLNVLQNAGSVREASDYVLHYFEAPLVQDEGVEMIREEYSWVYFDRYNS